MGGNRGLASTTIVIGFGSLGFLMFIVFVGALRAGSWIIAALFGFFVYLIVVLAYKMLQGVNQPAPPPAPPAPARRKCTMCAELVMADAKVCKHCGYHFPPPLVVE